MINIRQLRSFIAVCDSDLSVSAAAKRLYSAQPAVSKHVARLEDHVGQPLFVRRGKRFLELTQVGQEVLEQSRDIMLKMDNISALGSDHGDQPKGSLRIGTTHTQARYVLPPVVDVFARECPKVALQLWQGAPADLIHRMEGNKADMVICTENLQEDLSLVSFPMFRWNRSVIAPPSHPIFEAKTCRWRRLPSTPLSPMFRDSPDAGCLTKHSAARGWRPMWLFPPRTPMSSKHMSGSASASELWRTSRTTRPPTPT